MVEDGDTGTKTDDKNEQEGNEDPKDNKESVETDKGTNALDRAEAANKEKAKLLEEESKLLDRKEKLHAAQMVGGHTVAGKEEPKKEETPQDYAKKAAEGGLEYNG